LKSFKENGRLDHLRQARARSFEDRFQVFHHARGLFRYARRDNLAGCRVERNLSAVNTRLPKRMPCE